MSVLWYWINTLKGIYDIFRLEVGQHLDVSLRISVFNSANDLSFNFDDCLSLSDVLVFQSNFENFVLKIWTSGVVTRCESLLRFSCLKVSYFLLSSSVKLGDAWMWSAYLHKHSVPIPIWSSTCSCRESHRVLQDIFSYSSWMEWYNLFPTFDYAVDGISCWFLCQVLCIRLSAVSSLTWRWFHCFRNLTH